MKIDPLTKKSKGYGFIRYADQEVQVRVMLQRHQIDGRWCDVRIPVSKVITIHLTLILGYCFSDITVYISFMCTLYSLFINVLIKLFQVISYLNCKRFQFQIYFNILFNNFVYNIT